MQSILVDTGPLVALFKKRDEDHRRVTGFLKTIRCRLLTTWPVMTEAWHLVALPSRLALMQWAAAGLEICDLGERATDDLLRLLEKYKDRPMDLADASLVLLAEKTGVFDIMTIDRADFDAYRARGNIRFRQVLS
ncbi:MAG: type II toxin-antitoxin system VapC family toxin [Burkholderiales bacterium]